MGLCNDLFNIILCVLGFFFLVNLPPLEIVVDFCLWHWKKGGLFFDIHCI